MKKHVWSKQIGFYALALFLSGNLLNAQSFKSAAVDQAKEVKSLSSPVTSITYAEEGEMENPCDDKTVIECGLIYTAELQPNSGAWQNYTAVPYDYPGSEKVWEFTAPTSGLYVFELDQGSQDADFFIMDACSNTAGNVTNFYWTGEHEEYINLVEGETYYLIADLYGSAFESTIVSVLIQCPEEDGISEPDFDCFQGDGITSSFDDGLNLDPLNDHILVADDFMVEEGTVFTLRQITMDTNQVLEPAEVVFNIRKDENGLPGSVLETVTLNPTSSIQYAAAYNEPVYHTVFDLDEPVVLIEGTYWLQPRATTSPASTVWWLITSTGSHGSPVMLSEDSGQEWEMLNGFQAVFFVAGDCEEDEMGVKDLNHADFAFYPNPVREVLTINSTKELKTVEIFNLSGQKVMNSAKVQQGKVDMSGLATGTYVFKVTLENGQIETFKVVKK